MKTLRFIIPLLLIILFGCAASTNRYVFENRKLNPWTNLDFKNNHNDFQFAIVADRTGSPQHGIFEGAVSKLNLLQPEFVICVGDLIDGYTYDPSELNWQRDEFEKIVAKLNMPFFHLPGNHDIADQVTLDLWKQRFGRDYYYFVYQNVLFLCLNSEDLPHSGYGRISDKQISYFKKILKKHSDVRWTLVFMHKPLWPDWQRKNDTNWEKFDEMLQGRQHTVFSGHQHTYNKYKSGSINYYTLATTGALSDKKGPKVGQFDHIVWITMTDNGPVIANLALDGIYDDDPKNYRSYPLQDEAIRQWLLLGAFSNDEDKAGKGFDTDLIDEINIKPASGQSFGGKKWFLCKSMENRIVVDLLAQSIEPKTNAVVYAYSYLWSPRSQHAQFRIGSDDGCKVWVNSMEVIDTGNVARAYRDDSERANVVLKKGLNNVLVKITQGSGDWMFSLKITDKEKLGLIYSVNPHFSDSNAIVDQ